MRSRATNAIPAIWWATGERRRSRTGPIMRGSPSKSSSTTRKAARTTSYTATRLPKLFVRDRRGRALARCAPHEHGVDLRIRLARRLLATAPHVRRALGSRDGLRRRDGDGAQRRSYRGDERGGVEDRHPRLEVDRLSRHATGRRGAAYRRGDPDPHRGRGRAVTRLLPGPFVDEHHPARDGGGRLFYCGGSYADDLPYWFEGPRGLQLITPYTLDSNDMRFATPQGFNSGGQFYAYLKDTFGTLYAEGDVAPKMLSVGLHCRLVGCPGRAASLARLIRLCARPRSRLGPDAARHRPPRDLQAPAARWLEALAAHPHAVPRAVRRRLRTFCLGRGGSL